MKLFKKARKADITYIETRSEYSSYTCPFCKVTFLGSGISRNVTRFKCKSCKNEIIIDKIITKKHEDEKKL